MMKIPTMFVRGERFKVVPLLDHRCTWVSFEGLATEKIDGTNVRLTVRSGQLVRVERRRNPDKGQKRRGIVDGWYVDTSTDDPNDQHVIAAARTTDLSSWPDGEHPCEAIGPRIQGDPLGLGVNLVVPLDTGLPGAVPVLDGVPRTYDGLREYVMGLESRLSPGHLAEGVVFHHPDGRRAKIKRRDFPG